MKKFFAVIVVAFAPSFFSVNAGVSAQDMRVAVDPTYEPFLYKKADGSLAGFSFEFANEVCQQLQRKCVFVEQIWDSMIAGLQSRKYDVIISDMTITKERQRVVDFTNRYYKTPGTIVVRKSFDYKGLESLKGLRMGVLKGSTHERYANGELKPLGVKIVSYAAQNQVYLDIEAGRLDGVVSDKPEVTGGFLVKAAGSDYHSVGADLYDEKYFGEGMGIVLRKGQPELKKQLNDAIANIRSSGKYAELAKKYFDFDPYGQD